MLTYFTTSQTDFPSKVRSFATLPSVTSASALKGTLRTEALVSASFYESTQNNATITSATLYWSTAAINTNADFSSVTSTGTLNTELLTPGSDFTDAGISNYLIENLVLGTSYHFLIVIENEDGRRDGRGFEHTAYHEIAVSVPTQLMWAAFTSDEGEVSSPEYHLINNGDTTVRVSLQSLTLTDTGGLSLVNSTPAIGQPELNLEIVGTGSSLGFDSGLLHAFLANVSLCTLGAGGSASDRYDFAFAGYFSGVFSAVPYETSYTATFRFEL
jgi:hypothetical protein